MKIIRFQDNKLDNIECKSRNAKITFIFAERIAKHVHKLCVYSEI